MFHINTTSKKAKVAIILFLILSVGAGGWGIYYFSFKNKKKPAEPQAIVEEEPIIPEVKAKCKLSGQETQEGKDERRPIAVMMENHEAARPQSGLDKADIVFEALAEGGITRFMAVFSCQDTDEIGPVRSARPYYLDWASEFDAAYSHIGGSPKAMSLIKTYGIKDLDQFFNAKTYDRVKFRAAPHNVYTSTARLRDLAKSKGWGGKATYKAFSFKEDLEGTTALPAAPSVTATYNNRFVTKFTYDATNNYYLRSQGTKPFTDKPSGSQISAKNVVIMFVKTGKEDSTRLSMVTTGEGKAQVFLDGKIIEGKWKKPSRVERTLFYDSTGAEIKLNRGPIWIVVVPVGTSVKAQ